MPSPRLAPIALAPLLACAALGAPAWVEAERETLADHVRITSPEDFEKAGEAYFSPDGSWIIFQAVARAPEGEEASAHYSMYVAKLTRDGSGRVTGAERPILISPPGSANTCGFFHPLAPHRVIFGSTVTPPAGDDRPGYQRGESRYVWQFPESMDVVSRTIPAIFYDRIPEEMREQVIAWDINALEPVAVVSNPGYDAECAYSPSGRCIVYANVDPATGDADLYVHDVVAGFSRPLVVAEGYDGGPFFSPDGRRICYRSDRAGDDLLQLYVADLELDAAGVPLRVERERALTADHHVNWAPFWHPSGEFLVFATSAVGHHNYEVFSIEVPPADAGDVAPGALARRRITVAEGFDGLPVFSPDGSLLMWTSQRTESGEKGTSQVWIARVVSASPGE